MVYDLHRRRGAGDWPAKQKYKVTNQVGVGMKINAIMGGLLLVLSACANPDTSHLNSGGSDSGAINEHCGKYIVPHLTVSDNLVPTQFGVPIDEVSLEGVACWEDGSVALNSYMQPQQIIVKGAPVKLYAKSKSLVAVAGDTIVAQRELQEEVYGNENVPTGRWVVRVDGGNFRVEGETLHLEM